MSNFYVVTQTFVKEGLDIKPMYLAEIPSVWSANIQHAYLFENADEAISISESFPKNEDYRYAVILVQGSK